MHGPVSKNCYGAKKTEPDYFQWCLETGKKAMVMN